MTILLLAGLILQQGIAAQYPGDRDLARRAEVIRPRPGEYKWREIPWILDLNEGIRRAREEKRPILLWVSGDDPLERC